jgi:hypothetical protein
MTEAVFQKLSFHDKGIVLFTEGKYLLTRSTDLYKTNLYSLYNFYVESHYCRNTNKIKKIELVSLDTKKRFYDDAGMIDKGR